MDLIEVKVGANSITQQKSSKLLGVQINETKTWEEQINGKGGVVSALNQRLYLIRRLNNQVNKESLIKIADSIWTSKARYGLQLYGQVRQSEEDVLTKDLENLQKAQNKMLRAINSTKIKDKISNKSILEK